MLTKRFVKDDQKKLTAKGTFKLKTSATKLPQMMLLI